MTQTFVVYCGKGMGKTNFAAVFAEDLHRNGLRLSLLDPVGVRIYNDSSEAIELFNPLLNSLLWTNRAVSLNILDSEGKHVVDLLQKFSGSSISVGRKDWVYLPPGGYVVTREKFDLSSDGWLSGARLSSLWGSFKLQLAATDRLTLPRPRLQADGIGLDRHQQRDEEWYADFPGKVQVRSNAIEFELPPTLGK